MNQIHIPTKMTKGNQTTMVLLIIMALGRFLHSFNNLLGRIVEVVGGDDVELGVLDDLLAEIDIGAFEAHYEGNLQAHFLHGGNHAFGDDVAFHDAAEDVDQNAFDARIGGDDLEGG